MKTADELFEEYFIELYDDTWSIINKDWVKDSLDEYNEEYNEETINELLDSILDYQKELQESDKNDKKDNLYCTIKDSIPEHLNNTDIAKVLIKLANLYLNEYE